MCSSRSICGNRNGSQNRSSNRTSSGSGAYYALCALGIGLIALGIIMIVWTVIPVDKETTNTSSASSGNSTVPANSNEETADRTKTSSVALVLVGVGVALLLLSIFLGVRNKRRSRSIARQPAPAAASTFTDHVAGEHEERAPDSTTYNVPSYDEVIGSSDYPVRQSNLRQSTSQLPSYEDIIAAVENEGSEPTTNPTEDSENHDAAPAEPQAETCPAPDVRWPARTTSRASRLLRPLLMRRIKSDRLHLRDFRLQIRTPTQNPVTIEPITPPPEYENNPPDLG
ncbi:transmembrane protein 51b [Thalassophryne amazonica]|uniref:transmembrane protein 51b n=1 Tax=Thalassophryne amazonica TaxID=390379 RepID=UPI001471DAD9|nr:transmembrane protein 51b [Thalassophryne amazonica]